MRSPAQLLAAAMQPSMPLKNENKYCFCCAENVFLSLLNSCLMKERCSHVMQESKTTFEAALVENIILLKPVLK